MELSQILTTSKKFTSKNCILHKMLKNLFLAVFILALCDHVLSLECYITDVDMLEAEDSISNSYQDCGNYITSMKKRFSLELDDGSPLRCYTVKVNANKPKNNFKIKGCVPQGHCDQTVKPIVEEEAKKRGISIKDMKCVECMDDGCNRKRK